MSTSRPILFSEPMVQAIIAGRKYQTRRIIARPLKHPTWTYYTYFATDGGIAIENGPDYPDDASDVVRCPYGMPGDTLWVRETWAPGLIINSGPHMGNSFVHFKDGAQKYRDGAYYNGRNHGDQWDPRKRQWKPSIHMPRWASRITLKIREVRCERLQDISSADAVAEGVDHVRIDLKRRVTFQAERCRPDAVPAVMQFRYLWDAINADRAPWASNPWVWAVSFEVVK